MNNIFTYPLNNSLAFNTLLEMINNKRSPLLINGLIPSQRTHMSYSIINKLNRQAIIITHSDLEAKKIYEDLNFYLGDKAVYLPFEEILFYFLDAKDRQEESKRMKVLLKLVKEENIVIVCSIEAVLKKYIPKHVFKKNILKYTMDDTINIDELSSRLVGLGYERVNKVEGVGQFSIRGGIIDIYCANADYPVRVELFDEEIDSIRMFDIISQKSIEKITEFEIIPSREILYPDDIEKTLENLQNEIKEDTSDDVHSNILKIKDLIYFEGLENYIDYMYEDEDKTIFSYLKKDALIIFNEPERIKEKFENYYEEFKSNFNVNLERHTVLVSQINLLNRFEELDYFIKDRFIIQNSILSKQIEEFKPNSIVNFNSREITVFNSKMDLFIDEINNLKKQGYKILIVPGSLEKSKKIYNDLLDLGVEAIFSKDKDAEIKNSQIMITPGNISVGFLSSDFKYALITDKEIFGVHKRTSQKKKKNLRMEER